MTNLLFMNWAYVTSFASKLSKSRLEHTILMRYHSDFGVKSKWKLHIVMSAGEKFNNLPWSVELNKHVVGFVENNFIEVGWN